MEPKREPKRWPTELRLAKDRRTLAIAFDDGTAFELAAEYLRVTSPSAEVRATAPPSARPSRASATWQIHRVEPVGQLSV
jgi:DUF971 family protein